MIQLWPGFSLAGYEIPIFFGKRKAERMKMRAPHLDDALFDLDQNNSLKVRLTIGTWLMTHNYRIEAQYTQWLIDSNLDPIGYQDGCYYSPEFSWIAPGYDVETLRNDKRDEETMQMFYNCRIPDQKIWLAITRRGVGIDDDGFVSFETRSEALRMLRQAFCKVYGEKPAKTKKPVGKWWENN